MPNTNITVYLSDLEYVEYVNKKKEINVKMRNTLKGLLKK